jgi:hypothetical protein
MFLATLLILPCIFLYALAGLSASPGLGYSFTLREEQTIGSHEFPKFNSVENSTAILEKRNTLDHVLRFNCDLPSVDRGQRGMIRVSDSLP